MPLRCARESVVSDRSSADSITFANRKPSKYFPKAFHIILIESISEVLVVISTIIKKKEKKNVLTASNEIR